MKVLITDAEYPDIDRLERPILESAGFEVELAQCRTAREVIRAGRGANALLVQYAPITREVLEALPEVRIVSRYGVGVDTINIDAARERGVWVSNVPDYGVEEVATHAFAMLLSLIRHLPFYARMVRNGEWYYHGTGPLHRPSTLTLGVVGLGRIGRTLAQFARPCFQRVLGYDPYLPASAWPAGVEPVDLKELFSRCHAVSLHLPLSVETRGFVNRQLLARMPAGSYLVNTSRGGLVNLEDLLQALDSGQLAGAALDVLPQEPPPRGHPILRHSRVLLSPHAAWYSEEAGEEVRQKAALNIVAWAQEGRPSYVVVEGSDNQGFKPVKKGTI